MLTLNPRQVANLIQEVQEEAWYTTAEVATLLGVSYSTAYRYVTDGFLTAYRMTPTGWHRIRGRDLLTFLQAKLLPGPSTEDMDPVWPDPTL